MLGTAMCHNQRMPRSESLLMSLFPILSNGLFARPRHYVPKNPISTAAWYPQQPLTALEAPELFSRYDVDTLFYIFYYHVGSYQQ